MHTAIKAPHKGINFRRTEREPLELKFAEAWANFAPHNLAYLLNPDTPHPSFDPHDAEVAATIIQWLGSPVGQGFLRQIPQPKNH
jgi:hypothetical protein